MLLPMLLLLLLLLSVVGGLLLAVLMSGIACRHEEVVAQPTMYAQCV